MILSWRDVLIYTDGIFSSGLTLEACKHPQWPALINQVMEPDTHTELEMYFLSAPYVDQELFIAGFLGLEPLT